MITFNKGGYQPKNETDIVNTIIHKPTGYMLVIGAVDGTRWLIFISYHLGLHNPIQTTIPFGFINNGDLGEPFRSTAKEVMINNMNITLKNPKLFFAPNTY